MAATFDGRQTLPNDTVLIAGGGPVGMVLAITLAFFGIKSVVFERNESTTKWPKMDLTNVNSMELLRKLGLADLLRQKGVPSHFPYVVLFSTGLEAPKALSKWVLPSVDEYRAAITELNDGSQPQEPYQRISQSVFEAATKLYCDAHPLIELRFGWKVLSVVESSETCDTTVVNLATNETIIYQSRYVAGCDGASSIVRRGLGIPLDGGPVAASVLLVHFRSRDLQKLHKHGRFWHLFVMSETTGIGGACISQNEDDIFTCHMFQPPGIDTSHISSEDAIATVLGGKYGKFPVAIDEVLVRSTYQPHIAIAREYTSPGGRIYLAGDAAHQNVPTGGYGMNMGIGDAFDLGWKMSAVMQGFGGGGLLRSYEQERRPIAMTCVERSGHHLAVHTKAAEILAGKLDIIDSDSTEGKQLREEFDAYYNQNDGENKDLGIEMGQLYQSDIILSQDENEYPPIGATRKYIPSTFPGLRAPSVNLKGTGRSIFEEFGPFFSLVEFQKDIQSTPSQSAQFLIRSFEKISLPLKHVLLNSEHHAQAVWEDASLVLVRPDFHVAWRANSLSSPGQADEIANVVSGWKI